MNSEELLYWARLHHVDREVGFVLELTAHLSRNNKYAKLAKRLKDNRWNKPVFFSNSDKNLGKFQENLLSMNTPALAKKWFLKMNVGLDSFESVYAKFST